MAGRSTGSLGIMSMTAVSRALASLALMVASTITTGAIVVIPGSPISTQSVVIRLTNEYNSGASVAGAVITRSGSQFTIHQTVNVACGLPIMATLTSDFDVGALPAGTYQVLALIQNIGGPAGSGCGSTSISQSASFSVIDPIAVPTASWWTYLLIAGVLLAAGAHRIKQRHEA